MTPDTPKTFVTGDELQAAVRLLEQRLSEAVSTIRTDVESSRNETLRHFDVAVENIVDEMRGANQDLLELLRDKQLDHEDRIRALEEARFGRPADKV